MVLYLLNLFSGLVKTNVGNVFLYKDLYQLFNKEVFKI